MLKMHKVKFWMFLLGVTAVQVA